MTPSHKTGRGLPASVLGLERPLLWKQAKCRGHRPADNSHCNSALSRMWLIKNTGDSKAAMAKTTGSKQLQTGRLIVHPQVRQPRNLCERGWGCGRTNRSLAGTLKAPHVSLLSFPRPRVDRLWLGLGQSGPEPVLHSTDSLSLRRPQRKGQDKISTGNHALERLPVRHACLQMSGGPQELPASLAHVKCPITGLAGLGRRTLEGASSLPGNNR